jgi:hypothetical protein
MPSQQNAKDDRRARAERQTLSRPFKGLDKPNKKEDNVGTSEPTHTPLGLVANDGKNENDDEEEEEEEE